MPKDDLFVLSGLFVTDALWAVSLWRRWPEHLYERQKHCSSTWMWLRLFRIPQTKENCVRLIRLSCVVGMTFVTVSFFIILLGLHR